MPRALALVAAALALWPAAAVAQADEEPAGTMAIAVEPAGVPAWQARAFEQALAAKLDGFRQFAATADETGEADLIVRGRLSASALAYELHVTDRAPSRISRGEIELAGRGTGELVREMRRALEPVVTPEGIRDTAAAGAARAAALPAPRLGAGLWLLLLGAGLLLAIPLAIGAWLLRPGGLRTLAGQPSMRITLVIWAGLAGTGLLLSAAGESVATEGWAILCLGGLAWGWFAALAFRIVFPSFRGLERVEHGDVFRLVRAWSLVVFERLVGVALYNAPFLLAAWAACHAAGVPDSVTWAVALPVAGLLARFWFLSLVDVLSLHLDRKLVAGDASADAPWHQAVRGYVMGYVRRAGWQVDDDLLDGILFLPGEGDGSPLGITLYGGGLTHSRVVIGTDLLEYALAPYDRPHDYAEPREINLHWTEWNAGLVVPVEIGAKIATPEERYPRVKNEAGETEHMPLGEPPTLAGFVEPINLDPRPAHQPHEDPLYLDWDPGEEHDGTDPNDKDFLFGALIRELGAIERHQDERLAIDLTAARALRAGPSWLRRAAEAVARYLRPVTGRYPAILGDAYAAMNHARHHLIQYLAWRTWETEELLTARAHAPELERTSNQILAKLDRAGTAHRRGAMAGATPQTRLVWMSEFLRLPIRSRRQVLVRRIALAGALLGLAAVSAVSVARAIDYHPTYVERMEAQHERQEAE